MPPYLCTSDDIGAITRAAVAAAAASLAA
jgi:hypothetical protein